MLRQETESISRAFRALADESRSLALATRYQSRQHRIYDRAYQTLREIQKARLSSEPPEPREIRVRWVDPPKWKLDEMLSPRTDAPPTEP